MSTIHRTRFAVGGATLEVELEPSGLVNLIYSQYAGHQASGIYLTLHLQRAEADQLIAALTAPEHS